VWRVDESNVNTTSTAPGLLLVEASGSGALMDPGDYNQGDDGDPFPGSAGVNVVGDTGAVSTSFPGAVRSGVSIAQIQETPTGAVKFEVTFA